MILLKLDNHDAPKTAIEARKCNGAEIIPPDAIKWPRKISKEIFFSTGKVKKLTWFMWKVCHVLPEGSETLFAPISSRFKAGSGFDDSIKYKSVVKKSREAA